MRYISTRGGGQPLGFADVTMRGLAGDGGLYVPTEWPVIAGEEIAGFAGADFADVATRVIAPFAGPDRSADAVHRLAAGAMATFAHPARTPLVQIAPNHFLLELFHGPTLAFKDVAMQFLARLLDDILSERGARTTVIVATSGDTGAAAAQAFRGMQAIDVAILFPDRRISEVQRRQMTTIDDGNIHALAVEGTFDDCQALVKAMFMDEGLRRDLDLSAVNSINWARIVAQVTYYFVAAAALGAPHRPVSFSVPTGNFGDIFAGYAALRMGLPVARLVVATNENDILHRALTTGRYTKAAVRATTSPSMDIQVSSNFERLLFEAGDRDSTAVTASMDALASAGGFALPAGALAVIRESFTSATVGTGEAAETIARIHAATGLVVDPHTAVGVAAADKSGATGADAPVVTLATAHPAKFPDAVEAACGVRPGLPERLRPILRAEERVVRVPADFAAVAAAVRRASRVGAGIAA